MKKFNPVGTIMPIPIFFSADDDGDLHITTNGLPFPEKEELLRALDAVGRALSLTDEQVSEFNQIHEI